MEVHDQTDDPHIGVVPWAVDGFVEDENWEEEEQNRLKGTFGHPQKEIEVVEDAVILTNVVYFGEHAVYIFIDHVSFGHHVAVRGDHPASGYQVACGCISGFFFLLREVVDVLFEDGSDDEWKTGEEEVVEGNVPVFEDGLAWKTAVEGKQKLWDCEQHVFVEEVEDHLWYSYVVPAAVNQK